MCGGQIRIIAFITFIAFIAFSADTARTLEHVGEDTEAEHCASTPVTPCITPARRSPHALRQPPVTPCIAPARGPPLSDDCGAQQAGQGVDAEPDWELANQSLPDCPDDQRTTW